MLYLENGNKLDINPSIFKTLGSGAFGTVFKINEETCLKINNYDHVHYLYDTITKEELLFKRNLIEKVFCYDLEWNFRPDYGANDVYYRLGMGIISAPKSLDRMLSVVRILSEGFPQVRIDFYDVDGRIYFGEMTFTSDCGRMPYFSEKYQKIAGSKIDLSKIKRFKFFYR